MLFNRISRGFHFFGGPHESNANVASVESYQSVSVCLMTAVGLTPLCTNGGPTPLIESPPLKLDFDQAQTHLSDFSHLTPSELRTATGTRSTFTTI